MIGEEKENQENQEYQLGDDNLLGSANVSDPFLEEETSSKKQDTSAFMENPITESGLLQRRAMLAVGILISCLIIYKIFAYFMTDKLPAEKISVPPAPSVMTSAPAPKITPQPKPQPLVRSNSAPTSQVMPSEVQTKLASLAASEENHYQEVVRLRTELSSLQTDMSNLTQKLDGLTEQLKTMTTQLNEQTNQMQVMAIKITQQTQRLKKATLKKAQQPKPLYFVQAVIPGRAWLISSDGMHTVSVRVGSDLSGYGSVQAIDSEIGRVLTSSGRVIKFSQQDN